jgi:hypothetical protein
MLREIVRVYCEDLLVGKNAVYVNSSLYLQLHLPSEWFNV